MKSNCARRLAEGQVWKTKAAAIEILKLGKRLIHYRITKEVGHRRMSAQISPIRAVEKYLSANRARLVTAADCDPEVS